MVFSNAEGGKIKLGSRAWDDGETILPDQVLEVRMRQGPFVIENQFYSRPPPFSPLSEPSNLPYEIAYSTLIGLSASEGRASDASPVDA